MTVRAETAPKLPIIRRAQPADAEVCGRICYEAFTRLNTKFNFPPDFPSPDVAQGVMSEMFSHPGFFCVVAEEHGNILGSNCMDERSAIAGIGPITVDPAVQNKTVGRQLMTAVMDRAAERHIAGVVWCRPRSTAAPWRCTRSLGLLSASHWQLCRAQRLAKCPADM